MTENASWLSDVLTDLWVACIEYGQLKAFEDMSSQSDPERKQAIETTIALMENSYNILNNFIIENG